MSDEETKPAETPDAIEAETEQPEKTQEKTFTQAEVDALVKARAAKANRKVEKMRREYEAKTEELEAERAKLPGGDPTKEVVTKEDLDAFKAQLVKDEGFKIAVHGLPIDDKRRETLKKAYDLDKDIFEALVADDRAKAESASPGNGDYRSPGGVSPAAPEFLEEDALTWSADFVAARVKDGTLLQRVEKWQDSLPGGGNKLFRKRIPKP